MLPNKPVWIERSEPSCCIFLESSKTVLGLSVCMMPGSPGFNFFCFLTNGELAWWGGWGEALYARGLKGHTWETVLWCAHCLHESLHRPKLVVCCFLVQLRHLLLSTWLSCWLKEEMWIHLACSGPRLPGADSLAGSPWHCVKHHAEGEERLTPLLTPLRFGEQLLLAPLSLINLAVAWLPCLVDNSSHHSCFFFPLSLASGC